MIHDLYLSVPIHGGVLILDALWRTMFQHKRKPFLPSIPFLLACIFYRIFLWFGRNTFHGGG